LEPREAAMKKLIILIALAFAIAVTGPEIALTASPSPALADCGGSNC
jgi:hypothetical protein